MATLSRGQTFGATETVTNTKLHALVDSATISGILNADCDSNMGLVDTKLGDITTGGKVRGSALLNLPSTPSGAGVIPIANLPNLATLSGNGGVIGSTLLSLTSIPNSSLQPLTLASWVDGVSLRNLASTPVNQQIRYNLLVSSLASGAVPQYNGANNFVGKLFGISSRVFANAPAAPNGSIFPWTELIDAAGEFDGSYFTATKPGHYFIAVGLQHNVTSGLGNFRLYFISSGVTNPTPFTHQIQASAGDYIMFSALVSMGANGNLGFLPNIYNTGAPTSGNLVILGPID